MPASWPGLAPLVVVGPKAGAVAAAAEPGGRRKGPLWLLLTLLLPFLVPILLFIVVCPGPEPPVPLPAAAAAADGARCGGAGGLAQRGDLPRRDPIGPSVGQEPDRRWVGPSASLSVSLSRFAQRSHGEIT